MAKEKEKRIGRILFVENNLTIKDAAEKVGVTQKTFGTWVHNEKWEAERDARNASPAKRLNNIKEIISKLSEEWLEVDREIKQMEANKAEPNEIAEKRSRIKGIGDDVSKWNKTLESIEKESRVPLSTYIQVMEEIFADLREYDQPLFLLTVDFQVHHLNKASIKLG